MRSKSQDLMNSIIGYINDEYSINGRVPTFQDIAQKFKITKGCVSNYIKEMQQKGLIENNGGSRGVVTKTISKSLNVEKLPIVGSIACGRPLFAEENIEGYLSVSNEFFGKGQFFVLKANGVSMINAGINDRDYVIVRKQDSADEGQIIVALIDNEATLKRYYLDKKKKQVRLHPENDSMTDMFYDSIIIQGIAVKIVKDLI